MERPHATSTARSTSSATSTAAATNWKNCSSSSATSARRDGEPAGASATPSRGPQGGLRRRPGGPRAAHPRTSLRLVRTWSTAGSALCVPGNHDMKLLREAARQGRPDHARAGRVAGRDRRAARRRAEPFAKSLAEFLDGLVSHYVLDDGKLVVAHAGMKEEMQGRGSGKVRDFALYGETTGETDEFGLPVRYNWAAEYRGPAMVVYGHTPVPEPEWLNRTVNIDTGCVFGGKLTALRYPEQEFVSVPAARTYCEPARPFLPDDQQAPTLTAQQAARRRARRRRRARQADRLDAAARQRHDPRGERHGGAGSDEPVRRQPEVADLPAAHDVAVRDEQRAGPAGTPRRGVRLLPQPGRRRRSSARRSTWARGRSSSSAGTRRRRGSGSACSKARSASSTPAPAGGSSTTPAWSAQFLDRVRAALTRSGLLGRVATRRGSASTAN